MGAEKGSCAVLVDAEPFSALCSAGVGHMVQDSREVIQDLLV